jgi:hypothetical protein
MVVYLTNWAIRPHLGAGRKIHHGQKIHSSLLLANNERNYTPKARPPDRSLIWKTLHDKGFGSKMAGQWVEFDLYQSTKTAVENLVTSLKDDVAPGKKSAALEALYQIATSGKPI